MRYLLKRLLCAFGIKESSMAWGLLRKISSKGRSFALPEKVGDLYGFIVFPMLPEIDLKTLWKLLLPINNGHELIRVGAQADGGYLVPNDFLNISNCFSPGAGETWTFEEDLGSKFGIKSFIGDGTIDKHPEFESLGSFLPKNVGPVNSHNVIAFEDWVLSIEGNINADSILQMDIEGAEYPILSTVDPSFLKNFRIIVLELHDLHLLSVTSSFSLQFKQLMQNLHEHFDVVHLHPNNCGGSYKAYGVLLPRVVEITLHRRDRAVGYSKSIIPNQLDSPNNKEIGEFPDYNFVNWLTK